MAFRNLARNLFQVAKRTNFNARLYSSFQHGFVRMPKQSSMPIRTFSSVQTNDNAYRDLETFLQKEIQLEKSTQKHPNKLPTLGDFQIENNGPEVTLTRQTGNDKIVVKFNVTNTVDEGESDVNLNQSEQGQEAQNPSSQLKSRPSFTVDINRGGQTLSFLCSYLSNEYPETQDENQQEEFSEDFRIDEFTIHDGEWNETVYSSDCSVIDGELYDKLLNLLEEHGIGEGSLFSM